MEQETKGHVADKAVFVLFGALFFLLPVATSPAVIVGVLALLVWILSGRFYICKHAYLGQRWFRPVALMALLPVVGLLYTIDLKAGLEVVDKSYYWLFALAVASGTRGPRESRRFIDLFLAGLFFTVCFGFMQGAGILPLQRVGTTTGFMNHINYGLMVVFGMLLVSRKFGKGRTRGEKALAVLMLGVLLLALALSISRAGHLTFILLSPLVLVNLLGQKRAAIAIVAAILLSSSLFLSPVVRERVGLITENIKEFKEAGNIKSSIGARFYMWEGAMRIFMENPVAGVGTGGYGKAMMQMEGAESVGYIRQPHNSYLYMASTFGLVGLAGFVWYLYVLFMKGFKARKSEEGFAVLAFFLVFAIGSLTDSQILTYSTGTLAALMTGMRVGQE